MSLIQVARSAEMSAEFPAVRQASVRINLRDDRSLSSGVMTAKGDPEQPLTDEELLAKFHCYTEYIGDSPRKAVVDVFIDADSPPLTALLHAIITGPPP